MCGRDWLRDREGLGVGEPLGTVPVGVNVAVGGIVTEAEAVEVRVSYGENEGERLVDGERKQVREPEGEGGEGEGETVGGESVGLGVWDKEDGVVEAVKLDVRDRGEGVGVGVGVGEPLLVRKTLPVAVAVGGVAVGVLRVGLPDPLRDALLVWVRVGICEREAVDVTEGVGVGVPEADGLTATEQLPEKVRLPVVEQVVVGARLPLEEAVRVPVTEGVGDAEVPVRDGVGVTDTDGAVAVRDTEVLSLGDAVWLCVGVFEAEAVRERGRLLEGVAVAVLVLVKLKYSVGVGLRVGLGDALAVDRDGVRVEDRVRDVSVGLRERALGERLGVGTEAVGLGLGLPLRLRLRERDVSVSDCVSVPLGL